MPRISKSTDFSGQLFYVGLDVHKKSWNVTVRTSGMEVCHFTQSANADQLVRSLNFRFPGAIFKSAYEAGFCGTSPHECLIKLGFDNIIINPADLPQTDKQKKNKSDVHDSRAAARYLEAGVLRGIYIMPRAQQEMRALFRLRQVKARDVTRANNRLKSMLHYFGIQLPEKLNKQEYLSNKDLDWLKGVATITDAGKHTLNEYIEELIYQRKQLTALTKRLRMEMITSYHNEYRSGVTVPGFGPISTIALLAETGNLSRFDEPDEYCSYLGLLPAERSSGERTYTAHTQNRCNKRLRPILIEAAWTAIRKSPKLLYYYKKHAVKDPRKAIIKVAAKLALIAKAVILKQTVFQEEKI